MVILAGRGENADEQALLKHSKRLTYIIDVWPNEPSPTVALVQASAICTPHIAGHSIQGKAKGAWMVLHAFSKQMKQPISFSSDEFYARCLSQTSQQSFQQGFRKDITSQAIHSIDAQFKQLAQASSTPQIQPEAFSALRKKYKQHLEINYEGCAKHSERP